MTWLFFELLLEILVFIDWVKSKLRRKNADNTKGIQAR